MRRNSARRRVGVPRILQWRGFNSFGLRAGDRNLPVESRSKAPVGGWGMKSPEAEAKCEIGVKNFNFSWRNECRRRAWTVYFADTQLKKNYEYYEPHPVPVLRRINTPMKKKIKNVSRHKLVLFTAAIYWEVRHCHRTESSGADSMGHGGHVPPTYKWVGTGGTLSRRTANKKLTKLYWPLRKRSPKRLIVLLEPKKWRGTTKKIFSGAWRRIGAPHFCAGPVHPRLCAGSVPPTFKFFPAPLTEQLLLSRTVFAQCWHACVCLWIFAVLFIELRDVPVF